jgi:hypothetical protein
LKQKDLRPKAWGLFASNGGNANGKDAPVARPVPYTGIRKAEGAGCPAMLGRARARPAARAQSARSGRRIPVETPIFTSRHFL